MVGPMNDNCFPHRAVLTEHQLLGTPLPDEVVRHVEHCPDCAREVLETDDVVRTLQRGGPENDAPGRRMAQPVDGPPAALRDRIVRQLEDHPPRRRRLPRAVIGLAAAAVVAAAVVIPMSLGGDRAPEPVSDVALSRHGRMIEKPWGTEVPVSLSGLRNGRTYRMMAVNAEGKKVPGGSLRGAGGAPMTFRMVTAMPRDTISALIVEDEHGRVLTRLPVRPAAA